jgi:hypothetical protein
MLFNPGVGEGGGRGMGMYLTFIGRPLLLPVRS